MFAHRTRGLRLEILGIHFIDLWNPSRVSPASASVDPAADWDAALEEGGRWLFLAGRLTGQHSSWDQRQRSLWALVLYVVAGESGQPAAAVSSAQLRYRAEAEPDRYMMWLCAQLQRMGHAVSHLLPPKAMPASNTADGDHGDVDYLRGTITRSLRQIRADGGPDPVALVWNAASRITQSTSETIDGTFIADPLGCPLWKHREQMIVCLDADLVIRRGGWPRGARVRTVALVHYLAKDGSTAAEDGVFTDRAEIGAPTWDFDHDRRTVTDGPPVGYMLRYRSTKDGLPGFGSDVGPVAPEHLVVDLDGMDPQSAASQPHRRPTTTAPAVLAGGDVVDIVPRAQRDAAMTRLWKLRERDLSTKETTPRRLAERLIAGTIPEPPPPLTMRQLAEEDLDEQRMRLDPLTGLSTPTLPLRRHLVSGHRREILLDWLPHVTRWWTTQRQRDALDGLTTDIDSARALLADEGFEPIPNLPTLHDGDIDELLLHPHQGWLAAIHAPRPFAEHQPRSLGHVEVWCNALALDLDIAIAGTSELSYSWITEPRTDVLHGKLRAAPGYGGSLRVQLAVLRAVTSPVLPWAYPVHLQLGRDGTPATRVREIVDALPTYVHDCLGTITT